MRKNRTPRFKRPAGRKRSHIDRVMVVFLTCAEVRAAVYFAIGENLEHRRRNCGDSRQIHQKYHGQHLSGWPHDCNVRPVRKKGGNQSFFGSARDGQIRRSQITARTIPLSCHRNSVQCLCMNDIPPSESLLGTHSMQGRYNV